MSRLTAVPPTLQPVAATLYCARQIRSEGDFHSGLTSGLTPTPVRSPSPTELLFPTIADESRSIPSSTPIWDALTPNPTRQEVNAMIRP